MADEGTISFQAETLESEVSRTGLFRGCPARIYNVIARRGGWLNMTAQCDLSEYLGQGGGTPQFATAVDPAKTYYLRSDSANDASAGTGAQKVMVTALKAGVWGRTEYTLNGTTAVSLGSGYSAFQWAEVSAYGVLMGAAGYITIAEVTGAPTIAQTVEGITAGNTRSASGRYTVPASHSAVLVSWTGNAINQDQDIRLKANVFADGSDAPTFLTLATMYAPVNTHVPQRSLAYQMIAAGRTIKLTSISGGTASTAKATVDLRIIDVDNT